MNAKKTFSRASLFSLVVSAIYSSSIVICCFGSRRTGFGGSKWMMLIIKNPTTGVSRMDKILERLPNDFQVWINFVCSRSAKPK